VTIRLESYNYGTPGLGGKALQAMIDVVPGTASFDHHAGKNTSPTPDGQMNLIVTERAAGDLPDIVQLGLNSADYAIRELGAQPIDQYTPKDEYDDLMNHLLPTARPLGMRGGHLYASPFTFSTPTLFYNAEALCAVGLYPEAPPTTWEDVHTFALQVKAPRNIAAIGGTGDWVAQSLLSRLLSADGPTPTFNQPRAVETFRWLQNLAASQHGFTIITSMIGLVTQHADAVDDPLYFKQFVDKDPNLLAAYKQLQGLEPWLNWSRARQGVQGESLFVEALQNAAYGGQETQSTMDSTANRIAGLLSNG
jgi:hypothetical protein